MELELVPAAEPAVVEAARLAAAAAGVDRADENRSRWWRVGVEEALAARAVTRARRALRRRALAACAVTPARRAPYVAAPSPRSTRGATRA